MKSHPPDKAMLAHLELDDLRPHPDQATYFPHYDERKFQELVASIRKVGVETPIEVLPGGNQAGLPDDAILDGHTRVLAAREAGLTKVPVRRRYDLRHKSRAEIDEDFLSRNKLRRQLSPLGEARLAIGIYRARQAQAGRKDHGDALGNEALREEIGQTLGMCGRHLGRYFNVLEAPLEIQTAFERGEIGLVQASRVKTLRPSQLDDLVSRIQKGEEVAKVVEEFLPVKSRKHVKTADAVAGLARGLASSLADLEGREDQIRDAHLSRHDDVLRKGYYLLKSLVVRLNNLD